MAKAPTVLLLSSSGATRDFIHTVYCPFGEEPAWGFRKLLERILRLEHAQGKLVSRVYGSYLGN